MTTRDPLTASAMALARDRAALIVIDIQDRLAAAMPADVAGQVERNACVLIEAARRLGLPVVVSQQYPRGLGATVAAVEAAIAQLAADDPARVHRFDKVEFSACGSAAFDAPWTQLAGEQRDQWIAVGMETHVCVYQTARDLLGRGAAVHVVSDAVASRTEHNWQLGLDLIARAGGVVTSTEVVLFDLLGAAGTDEFKALSKLIK